MDRKYMNIFKKLTFLIFLISNLCAFGEDHFDHAVVRKLFLDIGIELEHFDGIELTPKEKALLTKDLELFKQGKLHHLDLSHYPFLPKYLTGQIDFDSEKVKQTKVFGKAEVKVEPHSIHNKKAYLENRVGRNLYETAKKGLASFVVHAGKLENLASALKTSADNLIKIPSFYEAWGIHKFVVKASLKDVLPKIVFNVPAIKQYSQHYRKMFSGTKSSVEVIFNSADNKALKKDFTQTIESIFKNSNIEKGAHVSLGYVDEFADALKSSKQWEILKKEVISVTGDTGIFGNIYIVRSKVEKSIEKTIVSFGAQSTLWGEASSFLVDGVLKQEVAGVHFLGSAGSLNPNHQIYDLSAPKMIVTRSGEGTVKNLISRFSNFIKSKIKYGQSIHYSGIHGNSFSPIEQGKSFLSKVHQMGITTLDVEQSLVANSVRKFNLSGAGEHVVFSAVNVITDKPSLSQTSSADLDQVDYKKKLKAKIGAVDLVLSGIHEHEVFLLNSDEFRKQMIARALPNIEPGQIKIKNGVGRIDTNEKVKMSYYIRTTDFLNPNSEIKLIPMATSRYDRYNYNTDAWWEKYGEAKARGEKVPFEDVKEVNRYLKQNGLSTNPDVYTITPEKGLQKTPLKDFLLDRYLEMYGDDKFVTLFRGIGKMEELDVWRSGQLPRGVRYWTPNATYAWRYARKRENFISSLVKGDAPVVTFKIPKNEFIQMVKNNEVVLGTELPKSAHGIFDSSGHFGDSIMGTRYIGDGSLGVEHEIRFRKRGRERLPGYFTGAINVEDLARDRIRTVNEGYERLMNRTPHNSKELYKEKTTRIESINQEYRVLRMMEDGYDPDLVHGEIRKLSGRGEIINNDFETMSNAFEKFKPSAQCTGAYLMRLPAY